MVSRTGFAKILDFGLARTQAAGGGLGSDVGGEATTETASETGPGVIVGTVSYMSPEQASGKRLDFRSDQFSFGSILYEMATGRRAFPHENNIDALSATTSGTFPRVAKRWSSSVHAPKFDGGGCE